MKRGNKNYIKLKCKELQIGSKQDEIYFYQMMLKDRYSGSQTETQHFHYNKKKKKKNIKYRAKIEVEQYCPEVPKGVKRLQLVRTYSAKSSNPKTIYKILA